MYSLKLCVLVGLVIIISIGYTYAATCQCFCCELSGPYFNCTAVHTGNITVDSCFDCKPSLCQLTYNSSCVLINGYTNSTCHDSTTDSGHTLFEPIYSAFLISMTAVFILIHTNIKY